MKGAVDPRPNSNPIVTAIVYISNVNFGPETIHFRVYSNRFGTVKVVCDWCRVMVEGEGMLTCTTNGDHGTNHYQSGSVSVTFNL